ncbi:unnamed protein product [Dovyalis caffra]|uniref:Uncharacterized protein n=1 Tax=Dovyalis caffra TaxID=77055 RepID=A0AAV1R743_9ROSI|nr:unnamed protein product [Dovyalis caffra]
MESNRKRKGFMKGKLMSFHRTSSKPSSNVQYSSKIKPSQTSPTTASVGYVVHQDFMIAPQKQTQVLSFIVPAADSRRDKLSQFDKFFGVVGDVSVDTKASSYITSVRERFQLERQVEDSKGLVYAYLEQLKASFTIVRNVLGFTFFSIPITPTMSLVSKFYS